MTGKIRGRKPQPIADRIKDRVEMDPITGCWIWQGSSLHNYGTIMIGSRRDGSHRRASTHRVSYETFVGPIPEGLQLDHLCRVTMCCNPEHLEPVTPRVNTRRGFSPSALNARKTHCPQGHEYTPENTYTSQNGKRYCRTCKRAYHRALYWRKKVARALEAS